MYVVTSEVTVKHLIMTNVITLAVKNVHGSLGEEVRGVTAAPCHRSFFVCFHLIITHLTQDGRC